MKKSSKSMKGIISSLIIMGMIAPSVTSVFADDQPSTFNTTYANCNVKMYGFIESDMISDSQQPSFYEESDTPALPKSNTYAGNNGRVITGIRNSRLGFDITMPETDSGLKTEAILEMDFLGNQSANTTPGNAGGTQSERDYFNNPTARIRHAYLNFTYGNENAKFGQTWSLLGWQPYYFPSEPEVSPTVGQLYRRFPQVRFTDSRSLGILGLSDLKLESAADVAKPAEMDSDLVDYHAGLRLSYDKIKAATGLSSPSGDRMVGLSIASSWIWEPITTVNIGKQTGQGYALDALIPIIPSKDGKDMSNNLSLCGEYSHASGIGGLELAGATAGITAPTAAQMGNGNPLDSGIAGINMRGALDLIQFETARADLTYVLPCPQWAVSTGYAQVRPDNLGDFVVMSTNKSTSFISNYAYYYGSLFYTPLKWLRFAAEFAEFHDTYVDVKAPNAQDNRLQFTTYISF
ncbi:MAG: hypothetical protein ABSH12_02655 [Endomicrobiales bacterium]